MAAPEPLYLDQPPPPGKKVTELHVWIATFPNGSEGICSADLPMPGGFGRRHMPLLSSDLEIAQKLETLAHNVRRAAVHQADRILSVRMVTYLRVEE